MTVTIIFNTSYLLNRALLAFTFAVNLRLDSIQFVPNSLLARLITHMELLHVIIPSHNRPTDRFVLDGWTILRAFLEPFHTRPAGSY